MKSVGASISYPLQVTYVVYTPGGTTEEINTEITTGDPTENVFYNTLPFFMMRLIPMI